MNKIKNWLRSKLRDFLGVSDIDSNFKDHETFNSLRFTDIEKDINDRTSYLRKLINNNSGDISHCQDSVNVLHNTIENVVHIGTDVRYHNERTHSWAVVCIEGNINIVKFVDLGRQDARGILEYLKHFEAGRHCIDTPYKQMFLDGGLFKF